MSDLFDSPCFGSLAQALRAQGGQAGSVRILVRVVGRSEPMFSADLTQPRIQYRLRDAESAPDQGEFLTQPITGEALGRQADAAWSSGERLVATGRFVPAGRPTKARPEVPMAFEVQALVPLRRVADLMGLTPQEAAVADELIDRLTATPGALYRHLTEVALAVGQFVPVFPERFLKAVRLVFLQAVSHGQVREQTNPRLSLVVLSEPGKGKKVLSHLASTLSPVSAIAQADHVSPAGLVTASKQRRGGWATMPGAFPRCSGGTLVLEDYHRVQSRHRSLVTAALMNVTEDGWVVTTKAAHERYEARTAVLLNGNRQSKVDLAAAPRGTRARSKDLHLSAELLSRIDVIADVESGDDPAEAGLRMLLAQISEDTPERRQQMSGTARVLQAVIARLQDRIPMVDLSRVQRELKALYLDLVKVLRHLCARVQAELGNAFDPDMLLRRMSNTVRKLVGSIARLEGRSVAEPRDVEEVWELLALKLEVVHWLVGDEERVQPLPSRQELLGQVEGAAAERWIRLLMACGGQKVTVREAARLVEVAEKQLSRELWQRGVRPYRGYLLLPTVGMYQDQVRQERMAQEDAAERAAVETAGVSGVAQAAVEQEDGLQEGADEGVDESRVVCHLPVQDWQGPGPQVDPAVQQVIEGMRPRERPYYDLPAVPTRLVGAVKGLGGLDWEQEESVCRVLVRAMRQTDLSPGEAVEMVAGLRAPWHEAAQRDRPVKQQEPRELGELIKWIAQPEAELMNLRALAVYHEAGLRDLDVWADDVVQQAGVSEKVKRVVGGLVREIEERDKAERERRRAVEPVGRLLGVGVVPLIMMVLLVLQGGGAVLAGLGRALAGLGQAARAAQGVVRADGLRPGGGGRVAARVDGLRRRSGGVAARANGLWRGGGGGVAVTADGLWRGGGGVAVKARSAARLPTLGSSVASGSMPFPASMQALCELKKQGLSQSCGFDGVSAGPRGPLLGRALHDGAQPRSPPGAPAARGPC